MKTPMEIYNDFADKAIGAQVDLILKPIGAFIQQGAVEICTILTDYMPEIGAGIVVICGVGMMITGNVPKWLARMAAGLGGAIIWLLNA